MRSGILAGKTVGAKKAEEKGNGSLAQPRSSKSEWQAGTVCQHSMGAPFRESAVQSHGQPALSIKAPPVSGLSGLSLASLSLPHFLALTSGTCPILIPHSPSPNLSCFHVLLSS